MGGLSPLGRRELGGAPFEVGRVLEQGSVPEVVDDGGTVRPEHRAVIAMPEGDTIHKIALAIRSHLQGERIRAARIRDHDETSLVGRQVTEVSAHGKHLLLGLDDGRLLRTHLGMYGSWHRYPPGAPWRKPQRQASLALETSREVLVCFNALSVEVLDPRGARRGDLFRRLGPDLLAAHATTADIVRRAREFLDADTPLLDVLLDQRVASGIGNVYKSELLFLQRKNPLDRLGETTDAELRSLYRHASRVLARNLGAGPRTTRFVDDGRGRLWVYARAGKACLRCGATIRHRRLGKHARATYWCPGCQGPG